MNELPLFLTLDEIGLIQKGIEAAVREGYGKQDVVDSLHKKTVEWLRYHFGDDRNHRE